MTNKTQNNLTNAFIKALKYYDEDFTETPVLKKRVRRAILETPRCEGYLSDILKTAIGDVYTDGDCYELAKNIWMDNSRILPPTKKYA